MDYEKNLKNQIVRLSAHDEVSKIKMKKQSQNRSIHTDSRRSPKSEIVRLSAHDEVSNRKFTIAGIIYELKPLTLEQDELLAPIVREMLETFSEMFEKLASLIPPSSDVSGEKSTPSIPPPDRGRLGEGLSSIKLVVDILKINVWLHEKRYVRRLLAVLLTEEGQEFDESQVAEREKIMAKVGREVAPEIIPFFFAQSGIFGVSTQRFSPETRTIPKTH